MLIDNCYSLSFFFLLSPSSPLEFIRNRNFSRINSKWLLFETDRIESNRVAVYLVLGSKKKREREREWYIVGSGWEKRRIDASIAILILREILQRNFPLSVYKKDWLDFSQLLVFTVRADVFAVGGWQRQTSIVTKSMHRADSMIYRKQITRMFWITSCLWYISQHSLFYQGFSSSFSTSKDSFISRGFI